MGLCFVFDVGKVVVITRFVLCGSVKKVTVVWFVCGCVKILLNWSVLLFQSDSSTRTLLPFPKLAVSVFDSWPGMSGGGSSHNTNNQVVAP